MAYNTLTLTLSTETRTALQAEADEQHLSLERYINEILARRVAHPQWPDRAESAVLAEQVEILTAERDRARDSAALHEASEQRLRDAIAAALEHGRVVASPAFLADFDTGRLGKWIRR